MKSRIVALLFFLFFAYFLNAFINPFPKKNSPEGFKPQWGVSFSFEQAGWYGLSGRKAYLRLISEGKFDWVRLPFFWDQMADEKGELKIDDLKFAIEEAGKRNIKVVVALGAKTPYYPEYHLPENIKQKIRFGDTIGAHHAIASDLVDVDKKLVKELSGYENISHWQIENEPFLANVNNWKIDESLIRAEIETVKASDPRGRPIILSHVGPAKFDKRWKKLSKLLSAGDVLGVNAYFKTQGINLFALRVLGREIRVPWPQFLVWPVQSWLFLSPDFDGMKRELESQGVDLWILEMQAEPYVRELKDAERVNNYFKSADIWRAARFLESFQVKSVGFWGANYWLYRESKGDSSWINEVKKIVGGESISAGRSLQVQSAPFLY